MGAFYVNFCVRGLDQNEVLALLRQRPVAGFVGPTQDGWTALVAEDIEMQDPRIILDYGRRLTEGSDRVAMGFLCHDEDLLHVWLFRGGARVGEFDSCPAYFGDPGELHPETMISSSMSEDLDGAVLVGERAFMEAFGLDAERVRALLPQNREDAAPPTPRQPSTRPAAGGPPPGSRAPGGTSGPARTLGSHAGPAALLRRHGFPFCGRRRERGGVGQGLGEPAQPAAQRILRRPRITPRCLICHSQALPPGATQRPQLSRSVNLSPAS